jgi:hypothetical protein
MKRTLIAVVVLLGALGLMRTAGDAGFWSRYLAAWQGSATAHARLDPPRLIVAGQPAAQPRATPEAENLLPAALEDARAQARSLGLAALIVHRHGHRVFEYFGANHEAAMPVDGGELAALPAALAIGVLADNGRVPRDAAGSAVRQLAPVEVGWRNPWSTAARQRFTLRAAPPLLLQDADGDVATTLSQRVWLPLRAADASLWGRGDDALRVDCCMVARLEDWMRLGDLLLGMGSVAGERIVSPDWVRTLLMTDSQGRVHPLWLGSQQPWTGDEPPVERDAYWFDLGRDLRIWLAPRRGLQILVWSGGAAARDTLVPNIILRGLNDQAPAIQGGALDELVPGH